MGVRCLDLASHAADMHEIEQTVATPLVELPFEQLCPGAAALDQLMDELK